DLINAGRSADALRKIDALLARNPDDASLRFQKGVLLVDQKRPGEAIAVFERMRRDFPTLPEPMNNLAVLYAEQGQIDKARAALESAVRSRPSYNTAYENLSSLNVRLASRAYARALQIDDSAGAPKLSMLKTLAGSRQDAPPPVMVAAAAAPPISPPMAPPVAAPAPAPAAPPVSLPVSPPAAAPVAPPAPVEPPPGKAPAPESPSEGNGAKVRPATANAAQRRSSDEARDVQAAVSAWATAWERKDMNGYFAAYVPGFSGGDGTSARWQEGRRARIINKTRISVELSGVTVELSGDDSAKVSFRQVYAADQLKASSRKQLELVKRNGNWLIRKESVGS
ncbi:MAG: tetratricopeptide repeat protein, partial [Ideonella sp.]